MRRCGVKNTRSKRRFSKEEQKARLTAHTLRQQYTRTELENERGYHLYKLWEEYKAKGILNPAIGIFWVSKVNAHGKHKGDKILKRTEMLDFVAKGGKVREIHHYKDKVTNQCIKNLAHFMDVPMPGQHGFTSQRNVFTNLGVHLKTENNSILNIDLEDAFHQVSQKDVYYILKRVFDINAKTAQEMASFFCENGRLFQGCPVSPLIFNIYTANLAKSMAGIKWLTFSQYADDLTFSLKGEYISHRLIKWLISIIEDCGCKANPSKVVRQRLRPNTNGGEVTGIKVWHNGAHHWRTKPRNGNVMDNNLRLLEYLMAKGLQFSRRMAKDGSQIPLMNIKEGLTCWRQNATANT